ncbi:MAG: Tn3 family transposase [Dokdonella sp.]
MSGYQSRFIGLERLPKNLSAFDVDLYFRLSTDLLQEVDRYARTDRHAGADIRKIALAAQLVFLRATGRSLDQVSQLPKELLRSLGETLKVATPMIASLKAIYKRSRTLYDHQRWAREQLGLSDLDDTHRETLVDVLRAQASEVPSVDDLVHTAKVWLFEKQILIPGARVMFDLARAAFVHIEKEAAAIIQKNVPASDRLACRRAVFSMHLGAQQQTVLHWLRTPPKRHSPSTLTETLSKIKFLKNLNVHSWDLHEIALARQHAYGQSLSSRPPSETRKLKESVQVLEITCFLRYTLLELTDAALLQTGRRISDLMRAATTKNQERRARTLTNFVEGVTSIKQIVDDESRSADERLASIAEVIESLGDLSPNSQASGMRDALADDPTRVHSLLTAVVDLDFQGRPKDPAIKQLEVWRELRDKGIRELPRDIDVPVSDIWRDLVNDDDRKRALRALEASAALSLRRGLRRGSVWIDHSLTFRERDQMLIPPAEWEAQRDRFLSQMQLPPDPEPYLAKVLEHIAVGMEALAEAHEQGKITIDANGVVHLAKLEALPSDPEPKRTVELLYEEIGSVQFPDIMLEVDSLTNISLILLGHRPKTESELVALYGALIAHGRDKNAKNIAAMTPQLDPGLVSAAMRALETPGRLDRANRAVVEFQKKHWLADLWGTGGNGSADSMSVDASRHLWNARVDPRRRTHAIGLYTHVLDHHGVAHNQPIVLNERQAGPAIHGAHVYNQHTNGESLHRLAVDTHGYTNAGMTIASFDGLDLCPRLRDLKERKLYLPKGLDVPDGIDHIVRGDVSLSKIKKGWDELLRGFASAKTGRVGFDVLLLRLGSAAAGEPMHDAADNLGKLLRTLFLCDYFTNPEFRRELHILLNRGESIHQLQRTVHAGRIAPERGRRSDELFAISGSHALLTNMVIAWNTHKMQLVAEHWRKSGKPIEDAWLRRMGPGHTGHINFDGTFRFGIDRYREILLEPAKRERLRSVK